MKKYHLFLSVMFAGFALKAGGATTIVSMRNNFFSPSAVTINVGDTVTWRQDGFNHNTESVNGQAEFWRSSILSSGQMFSHTFSTPGTYTYFCAPHSQVMRGTVTVRAPATPPTISTNPQSRTVNVGQSVTFSVSATGTAPLSYRWQKNGTNLVFTASSFFLQSVTTNDAGSYRVVVTNSAGSVTSQVATLTVNVPAVPPSISLEPLSQTVSLGQPVAFSVTASGTTPLSFQWQFNGTNITGATSASFSISSARTSNQGTYRVVVSNAAGSTNSQNATLTVNLPLISLTTRQSGNQLVFCWPVTSTNFVLESTPQLASNLVWSSVSTSNSGVDGTNFCLTNPMSGPQQFFRLRAPN